MPIYLPLKAITRSQRVRIAGQTLSTSNISYVDMGYVDPVTYLYQLEIEGTETGAEKGLTKEKYYGYIVTSLDASGNETESGSLITVQAGKGKEEAGKGNFNFNVLRWSPVPHAKKYNVYRTAAAGAATAEAAREATLTLIATIETAGYTDEGAANKTAEPPYVNKTKYNVLGGAWNTHKELQNHFAIGAVQQLGPFTSSNLRFIPVSEATGWRLSFASEEAKIAKALQVADRKNGHIEGESPEKKVTGFKSGGAGKITLAIIVWNERNHLIESITAAEKEVEPGSAGAKEYFAAIAKEVKGWHQVLYVIQAKIKVVTNVTSTYLTGVGTPSLGDTTNYPFVGTAK